MSQESTFPCDDPRNILPDQPTGGTHTGICMSSLSERH